MASSVDSSMEKYKDCLNELSILFETVNLLSSDSKKMLAGRTYFRTQLPTILAKWNEETPLVIEEFICHLIDYGDELEKIWSWLKLIVQVMNKSIAFNRVKKIFALVVIRAVLINGQTFEYFELDVGHAGPYTSGLYLSGLFFVFWAGLKCMLPFR